VVGEKVVPLGLLSVFLISKLGIDTISNMRNYVPAGQGILGPRLHRQLENILVSSYSVMIIYGFVVIYTFALFTDIGFRGYFYDLLAYWSVLSLSDIGLILQSFVALLVVLLPIMLGVLFLKRHTSSTISVDGYLFKILVICVSLYVGIEYSLELIKYDTHMIGVFSWGLVIYYMLSGIATMHAMKPGTTQRSIFTQQLRQPTVFDWCAVTILALATSLFFIFYTEILNPSWAYIFTTFSILCLIYERSTFLSH